MVYILITVLIFKEKPPFAISPAMNRSNSMVRAFLIVFLASGCLYSSGCKSRGSSQPANPFAIDRQTAPPPATFSHQTSYLGQSPTTIYAPQGPASTYTPSAAPSPIPANAPLPSGATPLPATHPQPVTPLGGVGSLGNPGGASLFQATPVGTTDLSRADSQGWVPSENTGTSMEIAVSETGETAALNMQTQIRSTTTTLPNGAIQASYQDPELLAVSSGQIITRVEGESEPATLPAPSPVSAEPKTLYAGQYQ